MCMFIEHLAVVGLEMWVEVECDSIELLLRVNRALSVSLLGELHYKCACLAHGRRQPTRAPGQDMIAGPLSKIMPIRDIPLSLSVKFQIKSMHSCTV